VNICFINPSTGPRPEIFGLAKHLPDSYYMTVFQPSSIVNSANGFNLKKNLYVRNIPTPFVSFHGSKIWIPLLHTWLRELVKTIKKDQCDLIHICDYEYLTSVLPAIMKKMHRIPTLIVNDAILGDRTYIFGTRLMDTASRFYTPTLGKKILNDYDQIVLLYSKLAQEARLLGIPPEKIAIIPNGLDMQKIKQHSKGLDRAQIRSRLGIEDNEKIILYLGRLVGLKRVHVVIDVIKRMLSDGYKVRGIIVGEGSEKANLQNQASPLGEKVRFTGFVTEHEKYELYAAADLFILPSLSEGLPTVLLECGAMGLPAISTTIAGIPDIIVHGKTGFIVEVFDTDSIINYAKALFDDEALAKKIGESAKKHVTTNFSWTTMTDKYQRLYRKLTT
jgi:glycosyltransferase involved in cell wall biosynthesis